LGLKFSSTRDHASSLEKTQKKENIPSPQKGGGTPDGVAFFTYPARSQKGRKEGRERAVAAGCGLELEKEANKINFVYPKTTT